MALGVAGGLGASTISCSGTTATIQACMTADSIYWQDDVDSSSLGETGSSHTASFPSTQWATTSTNSVSVSLQSNDTLNRMDNTVASYQGTFASGASLIQDTGFNDVTIRFGQALYGLALRLSVPSMANFNATINAYTSFNPSGFPAASLSLTNVPGGGSCPTADCNTAPFIGFYNLASTIQSIRITTSDTTGFLIDRLFLQESLITPPQQTPEPVLTALIGSGLAIFAILAKRRRRAA